MLSIDKCPICGNNHFTPLFSCIDTTVSDETFQIKKCNYCGFGLTSPRPNDDQLASYYQSEDYISHSGTAQGAIGSIYKIARWLALKWKRRIMEQHARKGHILDFGCGTGEFLLQMQKSRWKIHGIEPSAVARIKAESLLKQQIHSGLNQLNGIEFDAITLWHVLEHIPNLNGTLQHFYRLLAPHGTLLLAVPNHESPDAIHYAQHWAGFDVPRHLWHFTKKNMETLLLQNHFRLKRIVPMKLDAFYISLLSEKIKGTPFPAQYANALFRGVYSNFAASRAMNYSSLIYLANRA